jgi:hypothetical protein
MRVSIPAQEEPMVTTKDDVVAALIVFAQKLYEKEHASFAGYARMLRLYAVDALKTNVESSLVSILLIMERLDETLQTRFPDRELIAALHVARLAIFRYTDSLPMSSRSA